jgi:hypothetical protein
VQLAASGPQTPGGLFTVSPDVAKLLTVVALCKTSLGPIRFHLNGDVAKVLELKDLLQFFRPREGDEEQGKVS